VILKFLEVLWVGMWGCGFRVCGLLEGMRAIQKVALAALVFVILLMFVGAIVRASGAGMGCPDWPKCYGKLIPPTSVEEVDVAKLDIDKFKEKAERYGRNPDEITEEVLLDEFNAVHTWTEFVNRLCSLPVGIFVFLTFLMSFWTRRPWVIFWSFASVFLVGLNAWMGARIVYSGLHPGTITTHVALAMALMCVQTWVVWAVGRERWSVGFEKGGSSLKWVALGAFLLIVFEGLMGTQVREMTDLLKVSHGNAPRSEWVAELEHTWMYVVHRSFSWVILGGAWAFFAMSGRMRSGGRGWHEWVIFGIVVAQMCLGLVLSQVGILPVAQVLHVGLSSILLCVFFHWLLGAFVSRD